MCGSIYYNHDIIFKEEAYHLSKPVKETEPIDLNSFVRYVREKQRLCWKEIYLKFKVLLYRPEICMNCREYFLISEHAGCYQDVP